MIEARLFWQDDDTEISWSGTASNRVTKAAADPRDAAEARLMAALEELFATLAPDIAARLAKGEMPSDAELSDALAKVIQPELVKAAVEEYERLGVQVGVQFDPAIVSESMVVWAQGYIYDLVKGLTDTTRTTLQRAMAEFASTPGMTRGQLEALLEPIFGKVRAEAIAVTEVTRAATAAIEQYQMELDAAGIVMEKVWRTNRDELVCPLCGPLDGKPESEWGDTGPPPRHTRCRCFCTLTLAPEAVKFNPHHDRLGRFSSGTSAGGAGGLGNMRREVQRHLEGGPVGGVDDALMLGEIVQRGMRQSMAPYDRLVARKSAAADAATRALIGADLPTMSDKQKARLITEHAKAGLAETRAIGKRGAVQDQLLQEALSNIRPMGLPPEGIALFDKYQTGEGAEVRMTLESVARQYPRSWWEASNKAGTLKLKQSEKPLSGSSGRVASYYQHGTYTGGGGKLSLAPSDKLNRDVAIHELGHRFEYTVPTAHSLAFEFLSGRTKGEAARHLGPGYAAGEMARPDKFYSAYVGKDYGQRAGQRATEVLSMGFQAVLGRGSRKNIHQDDPEHETFMLGLLAGV